jgi:hypothetical protein
MPTLCTTAAPTRLHTYLPWARFAQSTTNEDATRQRNEREPFTGAKAFHFAAISLKIHLIDSMFGAAATEIVKLQMDCPA